MHIVFAAFFTHKDKTRNISLWEFIYESWDIAHSGISPFFAENIEEKVVIGVILLLMIVFSFAGAFAGIAYNDILKKSTNLSFPFLFS